MKKSSLLLVLTINLFISCGSSVEVSPEMQGFIAAISSTNSIDDAAGKYGYSDDDIPLSYFGLEEAEVLASHVEGTKTCYDLKVKHGIVYSNINVCWENKKIVSITKKM